jgi:poly(A) polymerase
VWDYVGGFADARDRVLRLIGDPETRYREDPVRMLRAVRFAAKLGFSIHPATLAPIPRVAWMLDGVPPARLFDEVIKLFLGGFAVGAFDKLNELGLTEHLFPDVAAAIVDRNSAPVRLMQLGLAGTDERVREDKSVTPTFLFAVLLWPAIRRAYDKVGHAEGAEIGDLMAACETVAMRQQARVAIPKRFTLPMREIIGLQPRFERREGKRALRLLAHPRFRAAYDFLLLRAASGEVSEELAAWWTEIQNVPEQERVTRVETQRPAAGEGAPRSGPRRRRRRRRSPRAQ